MDDPSTNDDSPPADAADAADAADVADAEAEAVARETSAGRFLTEERLTAHATDDPPESPTDH